jgi:hypothetical protein
LDGPRCGLVCHPFYSSMPNFGAVGYGAWDNHPDDIPSAISNSCPHCAVHPSAPPPPAHQSRKFSLPRSPPCPCPVALAQSGPGNPGVVPFNPKLRILFRTPEPQYGFLRAPRHNAVFRTHGRDRDSRPGRNCPGLVRGCRPSEVRRSCSIGDLTARPDPAVAKPNILRNPASACESRSLLLAG